MGKASLVQTEGKDAKFYFCHQFTGRTSRLISCHHDFNKNLLLVQVTSSYIFEKHRGARNNV